MREMLRLELFLKRHRREVVERGLLDRKPSKPREERKEEQGEEVICSERKMISGEREETR